MPLLQALATSPTVRASWALILGSLPPNRLRLILMFVSRSASGVTMDRLLKPPREALSP